MGRTPSTMYCVGFDFHFRKLLCRIGLQFAGLALLRLTIPIGCIIGTDPSTENVFSNTGKFFFVGSRPAFQLQIKAVPEFEFLCAVCYHVKTISRIISSVLICKPVRQRRKECFFRGNSVQIVQKVRIPAGDEIFSDSFKLSPCFPRSGRFFKEIRADLTCWDVQHTGNCGDLGAVEGLLSPDTQAECAGYNACSLCKVFLVIVHLDHAQAQFF